MNRPSDERPLDEAQLESITAAVGAAVLDGPYVVVRHPAREPGWRVLSSKRTFESARALFERHARAMRQGAVVLWFEGRALDWRSAPSLRTRW